MNQQIIEGPKIPKYIIDLDKPAKTRWEQPIKDFKDQILHVDKILDEIAEIPSIIKNIIGWFKSKVYYIEELQGMADLIGFDLNKLILIQLIYEASAHCTSIVTNKKNQENAPIHARSMEWEMDFLRPLTIEVTFIKNKQPVAIGTTWVGYVGILTGMSLTENQEYSVSVNFRSPGESLMKNLKQSIMQAWPIGFLLRETLCDPQVNYNEAQQILSNSQLIAPVYFTICGKSQNQGCIVTRNRKSAEKFIEMSQQNQFLVQTNKDHWDQDPSNNILNSIERRNLANNKLQFLNNQNQEITNNDIWQMFSIKPIMSDIVVYATIMIPSQRFYETRLTVGRNTKTFIPKSIQQVQQAEKQEQCIRCGHLYFEELNSKGMCKHVGEWHATYSDCNKFKCLKGLGLGNVGKQHYGCCYSTDPNSKCPKSDYHDA